MAKAVYRSESSGEVRILRKFRDNVLRKNIPGKILLLTYYLATRIAGKLQLSKAVPPERGLISFHQSV